MVRATAVLDSRTLVVRAPSVLVRATLFAVDAALLAAYYSLSGSLWEASTWWDVAFISFVLIPAVFLLMLLVLPLWRRRRCGCSSRGSR